MVKTSATKRLLDLLRLFSEHGVRLGPDALIRDALAQMLGLSDSLSPEVQAAYTRIVRLIDESRDEVTAHYYDPDLVPDDAAAIVAKALAPVDEVRGVVVGNSVHSKLRVLTQFPLRDLELLALAVTRVSSQRELLSEDFAAAMAALDQAVQIVLAAPVDNRFKTAFSQLVGQARLSLEHYAIWGPDGVTEAIGVLFARSVGYQATASRAQAGIITSALNCLSNAVTIVYRGFQIAEKAVGPGTGTASLPPT